MVLRVDSEEADRLARRLSDITGESVTVAVTLALRERLARLDRPHDPSRREALHAIRERASRLPLLDDRSDDAILGRDPTDGPRW
ncbi:type II toxin-antitoxin system VapB family antitoxin [Azospirillum doebereinerae]